MNEKYNVPGLEKGLLLLELLVNKSEWMTLQDITSSIAITTTMAFRVLATLTKMGYVEYNEREKSYKPSRKILRMGYQTIREFDMNETVVPCLKKIRDKVKDSVFFGVLGEEKGIFVDQQQGLYPFKFTVTLGSSFELHSSAGGKAILAFLDESLLNNYLTRMTFERYTEHTITTSSDYVSELMRVRELGYAVDNEESLMGVVCIGAPVWDFDNRVIGAIWVSGPTSHFGREEKEAIIDTLLEECAELSLKLGYVKKNPTKEKRVWKE